MDQIIIVLLLLLLTFIILYFRLRKKYYWLVFEKRSQSSRYGKMTEQLMPFLKDYPYNPSNFRFIGNPIDGIQFEDNKIIFIEFKAGLSQLTEKQQQIAELVSKKRVSFEEHRLE